MNFHDLGKRKGKLQSPGERKRYVSESIASDTYDHIIYELCTVLRLGAHNQNANNHPRTNNLKHGTTVNIGMTFDFVTSV